MGSENHPGLKKLPSDRSLVRSRQRVADHGEVFTPGWMIEDMLNLVQAESERVDARILEPACGSGNFLVAVLERKLASVHSRYGNNEFESSHYALLSLMNVYGIELLEDNVEECRANLIDTVLRFLNENIGSKLYRASRAVVEANIVHGDALAMTSSHGDAILFPEWAYLGKGKYMRRDFRYDALAQRSSVGGTGSEMSEDLAIFIPTRSYPAMTFDQIANSIPETSL